MRCPKKEGKEHTVNQRGGVQKDVEDEHFSLCPIESHLNLIHICSPGV